MWNLLTAALAIGSAPADRPNIVLILADDLGYGSVGCYGEKEIPTPNIDAIAKNGARFTDAYVSCPVCAPTRAGLLTGRYQQRFGLELNPGPQNQAANRYGLPPGETTLPEALAKNGYRTGMVGKWHLGFTAGSLPTDRGFQEFFGFYGGANAYFAKKRPGQIFRGKEAIREPGYLTDAFAREAVSFIKKDKSKPFFLYLAFNAVHTPMQSPARLANAFPKLTGDRKTFAGMLTALDQGVGRVAKALKDEGLERNTVVVFLSDNGGPTRQTTSSNGPLRGFKGQVYEGGVRVPFLIQWPEKIKPKVVKEPVISLDLFPTFLDLSGVEPMKAKANLEGRSLASLLLRDEPKVSRKGLFWRMGPQFAVRDGDWKLVGRAGTTELYNLKADIGEKSDLSAKEPGKLAELKRLYEQWDARNAKPMPGRQPRRNAPPKRSR